MTRKNSVMVRVPSELRDNLKAKKSIWNKPLGEILQEFNDYYETHKDEPLFRRRKVK